MSSQSSQARRPPESAEAAESEAPPSRDDSFFDLLKQVAEAPSIEPAQAAATLVGQKLAHFQVRERLGQGGMGVVYKAEDARLRRLVALKVLPPSQANDRSRQQRLMREARSAAAVGHPNIASIYEVGEENGVAFIAMEFLEGETLRALLPGPARPPAEVLQWALQIAQGLARAHLAGIVHRDLKPDNVMLCRDGLVKILDFGLAKPQTVSVPVAPLADTEARARMTDGQDSSVHESTHDGLVVGTPRYMSPEQSRGQPVDARSDIYSFGVMLLELCTGRTAGAEPRTELERARQRRVQDPDGLLRRRLLQVSARCLEPEPFARFVDGTALLAELQAITREGDGVMLPRPRRRGRALRALLVMGVAVVLVVGGMLLAGWPRAFRLSSAPVRPAVRRLTANPPENAIEDAALSQDGRTLAYVDRRGLWLRRMDPVRTDAVKLPERFTPQAVSWFPKGDELLVVGLTPGVEGSAVWGITPSGKARLISERTLAAARVAPDGSHIAWITPEGIAVAPPSMEGSWIVAPVERRKRLDRGFDQLAWSPDGRRLAYVRLSVGESGAEATLETVELESGQAVTLVSDPRLVLENGHAALAWAQDGRLFYALAERPPHESGSTLWAVVPDASTGEISEPPRAVHSWVGSFPASLTASATGAMSYVLYESQVDVYAADLEEEGRRMATPRRITLTDHNEQPSAWTPDGQGVLFMSDQDGTHDLYLQNPVTGETRALVVEPESQAWPTLTPDGQQLLYWQQPVRDDDQPVPADLMRVPLAGGDPVRALTTRRASRELSALPPPGQAHVRCPRQGRTCLLAESDGHELVFTSFDPYTGNGGVVLRQDDPGGPHGWDVSADGERLVLPVRSGRLRTVELTGNKRTQDRIVDLGCDLQFATWAADGLSLFATGICPGERPYKLFFVERTRSPRVLWESSYAWAGHPVPSPDGKSIALAIKPFDNDVWLLSGL